MTSANSVERESGALWGRGHGTADGWVAARGVLVDAKSCGDRAGMRVWESGVWVDGGIVEDTG